MSIEKIPPNTLNHIMSKCYDAILDQMPVTSRGTAFMRLYIKSSLLPKNIIMNNVIDQIKKC